MTANGPGSAGNRDAAGRAMASALIEQDTGHAPDIGIRSRAGDRRAHQVHDALRQQVTPHLHIAHDGQMLGAQQIGAGHQTHQYRVPIDDRGLTHPMLDQRLPGLQHR